MTVPASLIDPQSLDAIAQACREQGYAVVRELFRPEEVAALDAEARQLLTRADLIDTNNLRCRWQTDVETEACTSTLSIRSSISGPRAPRSPATRGFIAYCTRSMASLPACSRTS